MAKPKMPLSFVKDYTNSHHVIKKQAEWDAMDFIVLEWPDEIVFEAEDGEDFIFTPEATRN